MTLLTRFEFIRDAKSLDILDGVMEELAELDHEARQSGLAQARLSFTPWRLAKYHKARKRLYLRLWGSPENLPSLAQTVVVGTEARLKTEVPGLSSEVKNALAGTIVERSIKDNYVKTQLEQSLVGENEETQTLELAMLEASKDMPFKEIVGLAKESVRKVKPKDFFVEQIKIKSTRVRRFYSALDHIQLSKMFHGIAKTQVRKAEFARVLAEEGKVDFSSLRSAYSVVMALVLLEPGQSLNYYHMRRTEIRREFVTPAATFLELKDLSGLGFVTKINRRYYPKDAHQPGLLRYSAA